MPEARELEPMVVDSAEAVATRATLDEALGALGALLSDRYRIARISVRIYVPETDELEFVGVWSSDPTLLVAGVRMPARATTFAEVEARGGAILGRPPAKAVPLLDQLLRDEGARSWVVMPLLRDRLLVGLLSVASRDVDGFTEADLPFFDSLAIAVRGRLLELASV
jgi:GAF domain